jgi:hypothetical protein
VDECFNSDYDLASGAESAFAEALKRRDTQPISRLVKLIQAADYYVGYAEAAASDSLYSKLLDRFTNPSFISFNYDSLIELLLLKRQCWYPHDGFGVQAEVSVPHTAGLDLTSLRSSALVVHLHGMTLLYAINFETYSESGDQISWIRKRAEPKFVFDPDALGLRFTPFERGLLGLGYQHLCQRIIAPLPAKADALRKRYARLVYRKACELLTNATQVAAVGYSFADCDRDSFLPLLRTLAASGMTLVVVAPTAREIIARLQEFRPRMSVSPIPLTLEEWSNHGFPNSA